MWGKEYRALHSNTLLCHVQKCEQQSWLWLRKLVLEIGIYYLDADFKQHHKLLVRPYDHSKSHSIMVYGLLGHSMHICLPIPSRAL